jgi:SAM-dependent methyltransferase
LSDTQGSSPKLYRELAGWYHLLTAPEDYEEEAVFYSRLLRQAADGEVQTVLELGCGGGNNAAHMKAWFTLTLTDVSEEMLTVSKTINPEVEHVQGDMRTLRLARTFDAVFLHDAVCYMTTEADLQAAIETASLHCRNGGSVVIAPDYVHETFRESSESGGHDSEDGRELRYLEWTRAGEPGSTTYVTDFAYILRESDGSVCVVHDRHVNGLFPRRKWLALMEQCGLETSVTPLVHSEVEPGVHEVFVGRRRRFSA